MKIWVVRQTCLYEHDTYLSTHITEKGALITAIKTVREDLCDGLDEDELEDMRAGMPHDYEEDLNQYGREQLRGIVQDWWEYSWDMNEHAQYEIHQTQVAA
mgnify:CR=1 FL=1|tara:strand:+ start:2800 stop:3102 length:303 start_codon:yes stop_codon:yes gene_type:complete